MNRDWSFFHAAAGISADRRSRFAELVSAHADQVRTSSHDRSTSATPLEFAQAASDLAVDLGRTVSPLRFAVVHLRELTELVPEKNRTKFLFACWERWSARLTATERVLVVRWVASNAHTVLLTTDDLRLTGPAAESWLCYREMVGRTSATASLPTTYLLFEYVHATHERMAIPALAQCLAALVVRDSLPAVHPGDSQHAEKPDSAGRHMTHPPKSKIGIAVL
jgi:hypothetical protein